MMQQPALGAAMMELCLRGGLHRTPATLSGATAQQAGAADSSAGSSSVHAVRSAASHATFARTLLSAVHGVFSGAFPVMAALKMPRQLWMLT